jgi:hypothetical protein
MDIVKISIIAGFALFLTVGIAGADELDDMEITIRVVEHDDDINEVEHELSLPDSASHAAREHAEDGGHEDEGEHHSNDDGNDGNEEDHPDDEDHPDEEDNPEEEDHPDEEDNPEEEDHPEEEEPQESESQT